MTARLLRFILLLPLFAAALLFHTLAMAQAPVLPCRIVAEYAHDPKTSTQGLFFINGQFYESSGGFDHSFLAVVEPETGNHIQTRAIEGRYFAEGITPYKNTLMMLTWLSGVGFIHSLDTLKPLDHFNYREVGEQTEGWGLTSDDTQFILSSGTARLSFHQPNDFKRTGSLLVRDGATPIRQLNELEYVDNKILANIWKSDRIAVIDPASGCVDAFIDLTPLRERIATQSGVANGIAYDQKGHRLFVTGKHWDKLFEIAVDRPLWGPSVTR